MKGTLFTIRPYKKIRQPATGLLFCALLLSYQRPVGTGGSTLQEQFDQFRKKDQLAEWIYAQIQWVAKAPAARAGSLALAREKAWRSPRSNEEVQAWQDLLSNEGYALLTSGDIVHSTDAYTAAFEWARQHRETADEVLVLENILKPLGNNYTRLGDYEQALFIHRKALAIASNLEDRKALAGTYSNLANTCSNMGLSLQSLDYCRQGLAVVNDHSALCGLLLSEQADAYAQLQKMAAARESILNSIQILERAQEGGSVTTYWLQTAYQQAGDIYSREKAISPLALQWYKKALALQTGLLQQGLLRRRERAKLLHRLGTLSFRLGQPIQAAGWLDQCLSVLVPGKKIDDLRESDLYAENTLMDLLFVRANVYKQQKEMDKSLQLYTLCFATEKKLRSEFVTGSSKERSIADSRSRYEEAIGTAWDAWEKTKADKYKGKILSFMESSKSQLLLEELQQEQQARSGVYGNDSLESRIRLLEKAEAYYQAEALQSGRNDSSDALHEAQQRQVAWDLAQLKKKRVVSSELSVVSEEVSGDVSGQLSVVSEVLGKLLGERKVIRSYFAGTKALYSIECSKAGIGDVEKIDLTEKGQDSIRMFIHDWFGQGANAMIDRPEAYYRQAYRIYRRLFGAHPFREGKEYIVLPDGALNLLPLEALVTDSGYSSSPGQWPFVLKQTPISYGWSLQTLKEQMALPGKQGPERKEVLFSGFFLSGNPQGRGQAAASPLLKAIAAERSGLQKIIGEGQWYSDEQATAAEFRKALEGSSVVHISSHAYAKKDSTAAPHIELYDGAFYLFNLKGMEHHPALVVLSACRTGDGKMVTGEGVQSMSRSFTAGGTKAVVAGWWNVNDETAAQLMQQFYRGLRSLPGVGVEQGEEAVNVALTLRNAKLDWIKDPAVPYLHKLPYYWAALNYQGNPRPLPDRFWEGEKERISPWWMLILIVLPLGYLLNNKKARSK